MFEKVWSNILKFQGQEFHTIRGLPFSYSIDGNYMIPSRTEYMISKTDFQKVFNMPKLKGPGEISNDVRGSAYVWAIMNDKRIR